MMYDDKEIKVSLWLLWQPNYQSSDASGLCLLTLGISIPNMNSIQLNTNELL